MRRVVWCALLLCGMSQLVRADLVSYWPFEEFPDEFTTPDVVSGYDLEVISNGFFSVDNHVDGKHGKAFEFFGADDASLLAYVAEEGDMLPINLQPEFTISFWAKVDGNGQNDLRLFSESNVQGDNNPLFNIGTANNGADGSLDIYIRNGGLSTPTVNHPHTTEHPFNGEWSHIGWTYADGMHNVYVNGVYDSSYEMESFGVANNIDATSVGGIIRGAGATSPSHFVTGIIDEVAIWNEVLPGATIGGLAQELTTVEDALNYAGTLPPFAVGERGAVGSDMVIGTRGNFVYGEPSDETAPGLGQSWYGVGNPGSKEGFDSAVAANERLVPYFQSNDSTWWSGSMAVTDVQDYPAEVADAMTDLGGNNYMVKLEGEILIPEAGTYRFLDGVDDFTYLAIDSGKNGVAGDEEGEVLINDNSWTNALSTGNGGAAIVETDFDVANGGEWLAIEFNMAEGGGGDHGMLYWDYDDFDLVFPEEQGQGVDDFDAAILMIPDSHLRGPVEPAPLLSGEVTGAVPSRESGWEIDVNPADGTADTFALENPDDSTYTTILNVDGIEFHINALGDVSEGDAFQFLVADQIEGTPVIATEGWMFDPATGSVVFGSGGGGGCSQGDLDGSGEVDFADFLVLSGNFGNAATMCSEGDIDGSGEVDFADFLALSANFGNSVAAAESVPEPTGFALFGIAAMVLGAARRRR